MNIFSAEDITHFYENNYLLFLGGVLFGTFVCTWYLIPKVIWVTREKDLMKPVIGRSVHKKPVPTLGGVAFFVSIILAISLIQVLRLENVVNHLVAAVTILFMVGLKDDLVVSSARAKLLGQLAAIAFILFVPELQITTLNGFLGIGDIPLVLGLGLGAFVLVAIINSYNLIDGIDGLAAITGMIIGSIYAGIFYYTDQPLYVMLSLVLVGILGGYLRFNYSRGDNKIFMGDSGALIIGLLIGFLTLKVLSFDAAIISNAGFALENTLLVLLSILFIPFLDTTRSIVIRLMDRRSPFDPDRNHIHHVLLDAGLSHLQATLVLGGMNLVIFFVVYNMSGVFGSGVMTIMMIGLMLLLCGILHLIKKSSETSVGPKTNKFQDNQVEGEELKDSKGENRNLYGLNVSSFSRSRRSYRNRKRKQEDVPV